VEQLDTSDRLKSVTLAEMKAVLPTNGSTVAAVENAVLLHALATCGGDVDAAARVLGVERASLERRIASARRAASGS